MTQMTAEYMAHSGSDLLVVNAARTSFSKTSAVFNDADEKLIHFLAREGHLLPFRHPSITMRCRAPMFVARQLGKHQAGFSWSEESRRYIKTEPELWWPEVWRQAAVSVKQGSTDDASVFMHHEDAFDYSQDYYTKKHYELSVQMYNQMLDNGVAPEQARMILPQNLMITWVWTGTLLAWMHMINERTVARGAQRETAAFAEDVAKIVNDVFPVSYYALRKRDDNT